MTELFVNNKKYEVENDSVKLMRFLRDELKLTSVKDGCSEGACGTCTILVDNKTTKCCVRKLSAFAGKEIVTVEGLPLNVKDVFVYAFGICGAVQCGFCTPGMVIAGYALYLENQNPSREDAALAIKNNICRCTGYKKIIDGILLACKMLREDMDIPKTNYDNYKIGEKVARIDVEDKVLGKGKYPDDFYFDGMLHASCLRSKYPRAKVLSINTEAAKKLEGIEAVFTADDIPGKLQSGHLKQDWYCMIPVGGITHFFGDAIALVVGADREVVEEAKKLIEVEYEELEFVDGPDAASKEGAPLVHHDGNICSEKFVSRGNATEAIENAAHVYTEHFETPYTEHAFLEPECCVALPDEDGVLLYTTDQGTYDTRGEVSTILGLEPSKVKVYNAYVGGGFGGKEDVVIQHHAALAAYLLKKPVKVKFSRAESILIHPKRHPFWMDFTLGVDEEGNILGVKANVVGDTGAYASLCGPVLERACTHAAGPYHYENFEIHGVSYYTNNPPAGAFRGFGVTQTCFAIESLLNKAAKDLGMTAWEIRYKNAIRPGEVLPNGQIVDNATGLCETLDAVKDVVDKYPNAGLACAMKNAGVGVGLPDYGRVRLIIKDQKIHIQSAGSCIGQGLGTVLVQEVCSHLNCNRNDVVLHAANTHEAPDSGTTSGSRHTTVTGEALKRALDEIQEKAGNGSWKDLEGQEFYGEYLAKTDPLGADLPNPVSHVCYGYATQVCVLDEETKKVKKIVAAHDVGVAINPISVEGQIEGGVLTGAGFALTEQYPLKDCKPLARYGKLGLFKANNTFDIESIVVEKAGLCTSYGAKGVGEITSIPTAPAISSAYCNLDGQFRTKLPLENTPYSK